MTREFFPHISEVSQSVIDKISFPFHSTAVARIILGSLCWRRLSASVKHVIIELNEVFNFRYYQIRLEIFLVALDPSLNIRITLSECFGNFHKWSEVKKVPQTMASDGFKDFAQSGGGLWDEISWRKSTLGKQQNFVNNVNFILGQLSTHFSLKIGKLELDGF